MRFIKKKNLREGEEILYIPQLHWIYTIKPLLYSLPFFLLLLILWFTNDSLVSASMHWVIASSFKSLIRQVFIAGLLVLLVIFICRIFKYLNTEYGVTNKRLIIKKGVIRLTTAEIPTDRIESIYCIRGVLGRIFGYGTICVSGVGGRMPIFYMVSRPYALRRKIAAIIEKNKIINVVHGELPKPAPVPPPVKEDDPLSRYGTFVRILGSHK